MRDGGVNIRDVSGQEIFGKTKTADEKSTSFKTKEGSSLTTASDTSAVSDIQEDPYKEKYHKLRFNVNRRHKKRTDT